MKSGVVDAIVYTAIEELRTMARDELKKKEVSNILLPESAEDCVDLLRRFSKAILVVDWSVTAESAVKALSVSSAAEGGNVRSVLVIAAEINVEIVATAAEYGVSQVFS